MEFDLVQIERLLIDFRDLQNSILYRAEKSLKDFIEIYRQHLDEKVHSAKKVLKIFNEKKLHHYDLFRIAGLTPTENQLSDALASLLNPKSAHKLGIEPLRNVLSTIENRHKNVSAIISTLDSAEVQIIREYHLGDTIPDIAIISDKFIIFIENKIRGGSETYSTAPQTERQWKKLLKMGKMKGIKEQYLLGIFLSPEEDKYPLENNFIPMSVSKVVMAIKKAIVNSEHRATNSDTITNIECFLNYYNWF
ncbi:PD-(D/E)XK nuclease family protein [Desulfobacula sp.]|uniref:PD-(D/E)XK nuclease family protein n=1 Tax=Desulfobacula sp. TaxID=2593537 RepID=UPI002619E941|nr:PD-(D/E)XK nuclease family protein [Desulfobacula sp.]